MSQLRVAVIVEGHGEVAAVRKLIERIWSDVLHGEYVEVLQPIRLSRPKLIQRDPKSGEPVPNKRAWERAVQLAAAKLHEHRDRPLPGLILALLDADKDCPRELAPRVKAAIASFTGEHQHAFVLANTEYETWFVAAAESLGDYLDLSGDDDIPSDPETRQLGKGWIRQRIRRPSYSETVDQPRMTARFDLGVCRERCPSFDKLCRVFEACRQSPGDSAS